MRIEKAMQQSEKFLFDTCFDPEQARCSQQQAEEAAVEEEAAEPPPPTFSEEELASARAEAQAAGREQGLQEASQSKERYAADALSAIAQRLESLLQTEDGRDQERVRSALDVGLAIVRKLFPKLAFAQALPEIEGLIADCLARLHEEPRIVIRVADSILDPLRQHIDALTQRCGFEGKVVLIAEDQMEPGAVRVEWADGGAERDVSQTWRDIEKLIERHTGPRAVFSDAVAPRDAAATPDTAASGDAAATADAPAETDQPADQIRDMGLSEDQRSASEVAGGLAQRA